MKYIERNNELVRVWRLQYDFNGFLFTLLVEGTESEMHDYMKSEFGYVGAYTTLRDDQMDTAKKMGMKIYIAPWLD